MNHSDQEIAGIVSGKGPGSMEISLRYSGLMEFFETVIAGPEHDANKPDHIGQALQLWNFAPEEAAYIILAIRPMT